MDVFVSVLSFFLNGYWKNQQETQRNCNIFRRQDPRKNWWQLNNQLFNRKPVHIRFMGREATNANNFSDNLIYQTFTTRYKMGKFKIECICCCWLRLWSRIISRFSGKLTLNMEENRHQMLFLNHWHFFFDAKKEVKKIEILLFCKWEAVEKDIEDKSPPSSFVGKSIYSSRTFNTWSFYWQFGTLRAPMQATEPKGFYEVTFCKNITFDWDLHRKDSTVGGLRWRAFVWIIWKLVTYYFFWPIVSPMQ